MLNGDALLLHKHGACGGGRCLACCGQRIAWYLTMSAETVASNPMPSLAGAVCLCPALCQELAECILAPCRCCLCVFGGLFVNPYFFWLNLYADCV